MTLISVFTFGGPGGFQAQFGGPRRRQAGPPRQAQDSPLAALLPLFLLLVFALISILPSLLSGSEDPTPQWGFERTNELNLHRNTWMRNIDYYVNQDQWQQSALYESVPVAHRDEASVGRYSGKVKIFERTIENSYIRNLQNEVS